MPATVPVQEKPTLVEKEAKEASHQLLPDLLKSSEQADFQAKPKRVGKINSLPKFELWLVDYFKSKFTGTYKFKYSLQYDGIPIYGSSVIIELDEDGTFLFSDSSSVDQNEVIKGEFPLKAKLEIQPDDLGITLDHYPEDQRKDLSPEYYDIKSQLCYYFDRTNHCWRLVYITDIRFNQENKRNNVRHFVPPSKTPYKQKQILLSPELDYIIDAHEGDIVATLSNLRTFC